MTPLLTIREAADKLGGVPLKSLRRVAEDNGYLYRLGKTPMVQEDDLPKIVELCRVKKPRRASTSEPREDAGRLGTSDTKDVSILPGAATTAAAKLRQRRNKP